MSNRQYPQKMRNQIMLFFIPKDGATSKSFLQTITCDPKVGHKNLNYFTITSNTLIMFY